MADVIPLKLTTAPNRVNRMQSGDTINASFLDASLVTETGTQTLTNKTLTTPRIAAVRGSSGPVVANFTDGGASDVNQLTFQSRITGFPPRVSATGSDSNISLVLASKGNGVLQYAPGGVNARAVLHVGMGGETQTMIGKLVTASGVNSIDIPDFTNSNHDHTTTAEGGTLSGASIASGTVGAAYLPAADGWDMTIVSTSEYAAGLDNVLHLAGGAAVMMADSNIYFWPFWAPRRSPTLQTVAVNVTTGAGVGGVARMGVYTNTGTTDPGPATLVKDAGEQATTGTGRLAFTFDQGLNPGALYWLAFTVSNPGTDAQFRTWNDAQCFMRVMGGISGSTSGLLAATPSQLVMYSWQGGSYGALPTDYGSSTHTTRTPITNAAATCKYVAAMVWSS